MECFPRWCGERRNELKTEVLELSLQFAREGDKNSVVKVDRDLLYTLNEADRVTIEQDAHFMVYCVRDGDTINLYDHSKNDGVTALIASYIILQ